MYLFNLHQQTCHFKPYKSAWRKIWKQQSISYTKQRNISKEKVALRNPFFDILVIKRVCAGDLLLLTSDPIYIKSEDSV